MPPSAAHLYLGRPPQDRLVEHATPHAGFAAAARRRPRATWLVDLRARQTLPYGEGLRLVERAGASLRCGPGAFVGILPSNSTDSAVLILAVLRARATAVLLSPRQPDVRIAEQAARADCQLVLDCADRRPSVACEVVEGREVLAAEAPGAIDGEPAPDDLAVLVYTSGSTAASKAVALTHYNLAVNAEALIRHHRLGPETVALASLPLSHVNALGFTLIAVAMAGGRTILVDEFEPRAYFAAAASHGATLASVVPSLLTALADVDDVPELPRLEYFVSAAAPLGAGTARQVCERIGKRIVQGYGLSETTNFSTLMPRDLEPDEYRCVMLESSIPPVGVPVFGNEVAVLDPGGAPVADGKTGEICMRGHNVMAGYFDDPEATAQAFRGGWFHSGDIGRFETYAGGRRFLCITGRAKNVVKVGGESVSLEEIERALETLPEVVEAGAVGLPHRLLGEEVAAAVVARDATLDDRAVREALLAVLPAAHVPTRLRLVTRLPRVANGKLDRRELATWW